MSLSGRFVSLVQSVRGKESCSTLVCTHLPSSSISPICSTEVAGSSDRKKDFAPVKIWKGADRSPSI